MHRNLYSHFLVKLLYHSGALCWTYCQYEAEVESNLPTLKTDSYGLPTGRMSKRLSILHQFWRNNSKNIRDSRVNVMFFLQTKCSRNCSNG